MNKFPQLEIITISELMTSLWDNFQERSEVDKALFPNDIMTNSLCELLDIVAQQHQVNTLAEDHWAEADIKQLLKDSMEDIDLLKQSLDNEAGASFPRNDTIKYIEFICNQFNERCTVMEQDMHYCVEKFQDVIKFKDGEVLLAFYLIFLYSFLSSCNGIGC